MSARQTARRVSDLSADRLWMLNTGAAEASTLTECLAVDFAVLMDAALPEIGNGAITIMDREKAAGISKRMTLAAELILDRIGERALPRLCGHPSDTVRGWACFLIGQAPDQSLSARLAKVRPLADDPHFGVREWSWMAMRPHLAADIDAAVRLLRELTASPSERLRRFSSEALRPRGVWCAHIAMLKRQPERALPILEALRADPSPYVRDSVGNWLNDAAKDRPDWVRSLCARWREESSTPATSRICKRARRSIDRAD